MGKRRVVWLSGGVLCALLSACTNLPGAFCAVGGDCDRSLIEAPFDPVPGDSDDSVAVCQVFHETRLAALRQNSESICFEVAAAYEAYMACVVEDGGCDPFRLIEPECKDEYEDWQDLEDEAGGRCVE